VADLEVSILRDEDSFNVKGLGKVLEQAYIGTPDPKRSGAWTRKSFPPSGVGYGSGTCPRRWFYEFHRKLIRVDDKGALEIANMNYGTEAHERIQKVFKDAGILVEAERALDTYKEPIAGVPPVKGFVDLIVDWNGLAVGEIKTTKQEAFTLLKAKGKPRGYQLIQLLIYMKILGIDRGFILYENKNTGEFLIFPVEMDEENRQVVDEAFEWMNKVAALKRLPKRPFNKSDLACKTCPLTEHCWSDTVGITKMEPLRVPE